MPSEMYSCSKSQKSLYNVTLGTENISTQLFSEHENCKRESDVAKVGDQAPTSMYKA